MEPVGTFGNSGAEYFQAATVSLTATMSSEQLGSDPYGRALSTLTCARSHNFHGTINPCRKIGVLLCSKCHQVKYCSKGCQNTHRKQHDKICNSSYASKKWTPTFERERRPPAWMGNGGLPVSFGKAGNYLWGNMPAFDALNIAMNEGVAAKDQDIALCFAASGDLRNVIKTINGLPSDYTGKCTLVINDFHPLVAIRSIVLLCVLLDASGPSEEVAAEVALHALYSSKLTTAQHTFLHTLIKRIEGLEREREVGLAGQWALGSHCTLKWAYPPEVGELLANIRAATYPMHKAEANRRRIMLAPSRIDYRDRYYTCLRRRHRAGFAHQRETGVLLPIGQPIDSFNTVNRLLYSEDGDWLLKDNASPASAWAPLEVEATRQKLDLPKDDYIGSLFFHIKHQLAEFAGRARRFNMEIVLSAIDLLVLPDLLDIMGMDDLRFDRVETSNVMDTLGPAEIISIWGPRLNFRNPCSTLLMYSMNWAFHVSGGRADVQGPNEMMDTMAELIDYLGIDGEAEPAKPPPISLLTNNLGAFFDTRPPFQRYLHQNGVTIASRLFGVQERKEPRILPARFGVGISEFDSPRITITPEQFYFTGHILFPSWHERFIEFEVVKEPMPEFIGSVGKEPIPEATALNSGEKEPIPEIIGSVEKGPMPELLGSGGEEEIPELVGSVGKEPMPEVADPVAKELIPEAVGSVGKEPTPEVSGSVEITQTPGALGSFFVPSTILWPIGVLLIGYLLSGFGPPSL